ncbi:MAG: DUF3243 domain-containing protein [Peptococcaceae bacterium]|nr:DUF3243 domain-containing protein [Candidatus Syntrophopropionicum ammoniitolerans]
MNNMLNNWDQWKRMLGQAVEYAQELGIPNNQINSMAQQLGDILAEKVPPGNPEQQAMKELWEVAENNEKQVLACLMTKLVSK